MVKEGQSPIVRMLLFLMGLCLTALWIASALTLGPTHGASWFELIVAVLTFVAVATLSPRASLAWRIGWPIALTALLVAGAIALWTSTAPSFYGWCTFFLGIGFAVIAVGVGLGWPVSPDAGGRTEEANRHLAAGYRWQGDSYGSGWPLFGAIGPRPWERGRHPTPTEVDIPDADLLREVHQAIARAPALQIYHLQIEVRQGEVTVEGTVKQQPERERVDQIIAGVPGVRGISNHLRLLRRHRS